MNARQSGFSLIELMIAITLGLLLLAGIVTLFQNSMKSNGDLAASKRLENNLHATLDLIARDLRRSGGMGDPLRQLMGATNPFGRDAPSALAGETANSCMTFRYDLNGNGVLDTNAPDERFGFRLRQGVVQLRGGGQSCSADVGSAWSEVTTASVVEITTLQFDVISSTVRGITQQAVRVGIAGRLVADPLVTRALSRNVRVRNDSYAP